MTYEKRNGIQARGTNTFRLTYKDYRETFHGSTAAAKKRRAEIVTDSDRGLLLAAGKAETVEALVERYLEHRIATGHLREGKPVNSYRSYFANHAGAVAGMRVGEVRANDVQKVLDAMTKAGLAASSVRQLGALLGGAFRYAMRTRLITVNPMHGVSLPQAQRREIVTPTTAQIAAVIGKAEDNYRAPLSLAAATGARRGEVCALRWSNVYLDGKHEGCTLDQVPHLHIAGTMQRVEGKLRTMAPKTRSGRRGVPLPLFAVTILEQHRAEQVRRRLACGPAWTDLDLVIDGGHGQPIDPDTLGDSFRRAAKLAGVEGVRLHDLRHAWATQMISAKQSPAAVAAFLGHSQVSFTLTTYVHPDAEMGAPIAAAAEAALGKALG